MGAPTRHRQLRMPTEHQPDPSDDPELFHRMTGVSSGIIKRIGALELCSLCFGKEPSPRSLGLTTDLG